MKGLVFLVLCDSISVEVICGGSLVNVTIDKEVLIMKKLSLIKAAVVVSVLLALVGCGAKSAGSADAGNQVILSEDVLAALDDLYSVQINYSNGTAPLNIIPFVTVETIYNAWDDVAISGNDKAPISLREYVDPNVVYLDYSTDYSVKWYKDTGDVVVEPTDVAARDDYAQKQHK